MTNQKSHAIVAMIACLAGFLIFQKVQTSLVSVETARLWSHFKASRSRAERIDLAFQMLDKGYKQEASLGHLLKETRFIGHEKYLAKYQQIDNWRPQDFQQKTAFSTLRFRYYFARKKWLHCQRAMTFGLLKTPEDQHRFVLMLSFLEQFEWSWELARPLFGTRPGLRLELLERRLKLDKKPNRSYCHETMVEILLAANPEFGALTLLQLLVKSDAKLTCAYLGRLCQRFRSRDFEKLRLKASILAAESFIRQKQLPEFLKGGGHKATKIDAWGRQWKLNEHSHAMIFNIPKSSQLSKTETQTLVFHWP